MKWFWIPASFFLLFTSSCLDQRDEIPNESANDEKQAKSINITREQFHDKVLGLLIGSAIGDAMGAPTEMWSRNDIQLDYGFVEGLDSMVRAPSAEGTWKYNLPAGGTTDDTRWKKLTAEYLIKNTTRYSDPVLFARHIVDEYKQQIENLKNTSGFDPEPYEENLMKVAWLQEWAIVAKPFAENDLQGYAKSLQKFYGGEMTCAGMLYSPILAVAAPGDPVSAYDGAYDLGIFDIGYARDMTGLVCAMTAAAFNENATPQSVMNINRDIDPENYFKSRLVGRSAYRFYRYARSIKFETDTIIMENMTKNIHIPRSMQHLDTLEYLRISKAYDLLDQANEDVAFHPGEVYLITMTAMIICDFDFSKTMRFIVNYGRDNDTVAAIAGAILGAYHGAEKLPEDQKNLVLQVNKDVLGIDLIELANNLTDKMMPPLQ
jgi:hypothetical protein